MTTRVLDHVGIVARDLSVLRDTWRRLGFAPTEPRPLLGRDAAGNAVPLGQSSCHAVFDRGYVELTTVDAGAGPHHLDPWRTRGEGGWIVAFGAADAEAARARCVAASLPVTPVMHASRAIDYGAQHGDAQFRWFMLEAAATPEALLCVVEHRTPELVFQPEVRRHPNGAQSLVGAVLVAHEPDALAGRYERLLGVAPSPIPGGLRFVEGGERVDLLTPAGFAQRYPRATRPVAGLAALRVAVARVDAVAPLLAQHGVAAVATADGLRVDPRDAGGVLVEFTA
jgi:hypothetical protein